jgi:hypothetical protein
MRLSEAIRLGAMLGAQTMGALTRGGTSSCALGAAYLAAGLLTAKRSSVKIHIAVRTFPAIVAPVHACPCCSFRDLVDLGDVVVHLNDFHMWSREKIADWVATIEPPESSSSPVRADGHVPDVVDA